MTSEDATRRYFDQLCRHGHAAVADWPLDGEPEAFGLVLAGEKICVPQAAELLDPVAVRAALDAPTRGWLRRLDIRSVIDSTNAEMMRASEPVSGWVLMAELQTGGRGRRGRAWASPFAGNLALTMGLETERGAGELGGLSLAVGVAVAGCLEAAGATGVGLKWPNDVLVGGRKLCGILVEIAASGPPAAIVLGIGVNLRVPAQVARRVGQPIVALTSLVGQVARNRLAGEMTSAVRAAVAAFDRQGFSPDTRAAFTARHVLHHREVLLSEGERQTPAKVTGVSAQGGLLVEDAGGRREVVGGEVSVRPR